MGPTRPASAWISARCRGWTTRPCSQDRQASGEEAKLDVFSDMRRYGLDERWWQGVFRDLQPPSRHAPEPRTATYNTDAANC